MSKILLERPRGNTRTVGFSVNDSVMRAACISDMGRLCVPLSEES